MHFRYLITCTIVFQKSILAVGSAFVGLSDPWRADMVAVNGEVLGINFRSSKFLFFQ